MVRRRKDWAFFAVKNVESTHFFVVIFVIAWKESRNRKSLVIEGARQAGKTWMMKGFGCRANRDTVYINFDSNSMMMQLFTSDLNTERFAKLLERQDYSMITIFRQTYIDVLKQYYFVGGMPEAVYSFS